jgi:hypothetical protein
MENFDPTVIPFTGILSPSSALMPEEGIALHREKISQLLTEPLP